MHKFGKTSKARLDTCHPDLQLIMNRAIELSNVDMGIAEGHRSVEKQQEYFNAGKSRIDGITKKGKHNYTPSLAVDIYAYVNGAANWDIEQLCYLAGIIHVVSETYFSTGKTKHKIRWGGNWDMDGVILIDQNFDDGPHFELIIP